MNLILASQTRSTNYVARFEVPLQGAGFRNDPEQPMVAQTRIMSTGDVAVELEIDPGSAGFENISWLSPIEARAYATAILRAAEVAEIAQQALNAPIDGLAAA